MKRDRLCLEEDADLNVLKGRRIAVLGYGSQGHAQAQNLRDSGLNVIIGNMEDRFAAQAHKDGFEVVSIADAVKRGDVVLMLIPDEEQPSIYHSQIAPHLRDGQVLCFASGYAVHFNLIHAPPFVDVVLAVPTCVGDLVRERFVKGQGVFGHFGVHQDHSGKAREIALALAKGIGLLRFGATECSFRDEVLVNLFAESAGLGAVYRYLLTAYEVLMEAGFSAEAAYAETFYENQFFSEGLSRMPSAEAVAYGSPAATYLILSKTKEVVNEDVKQRMHRMLQRIESGELVREWQVERLTGQPVLHQLKQEAIHHPIREVELLFLERKKASGG